MFSDPLKLLPAIGAIGVLILIGIGKLTEPEALALLGGIVALHATISSVNNVNPK